MAAARTFIAWTSLWQAGDNGTGPLNHDWASSGAAACMQTGR
jgi:hypothetical protein